MDSDGRDRGRGVLIGLAAGDRNGGPIRMALRLAQSLLDRRAFEEADLMRRYLAWWREDGIDSGPTAGRVFELINGGKSPAEAAERVHAECRGLTAGCNAAHRSPPLAMAGFLADETLAEIAGREAALTHRHPLAGDVSAAVVLLCQALFRGVAPEDALARAALGRTEETRGALADGTIAPGGRGGYAPEALQAAVYFVHNASGFDEAMREALAFAGPANYCPVLVGPLAGARWGAGAIDPRWLDHQCLCEIETAVEEAASALASASGWPESGPEQP